MVKRYFYDTKKCWPYNFDGKGHLKGIRTRSNISDEIIIGVEDYSQFTITFIDLKATEVNPTWDDCFKIESFGDSLFSLRNCYDLIDALSENFRFINKPRLRELLLKLGFEERSA
jgi:hypothetical protein